MVAAAAIGLSGLAGAYLGVSRSLAASGSGGEEAALAAAPVTPVASAKPILAPAMDEAEVRRLAREEAQAVLARAQPKRPEKEEEADQADDAPSTQLTPVAPAAPPPPAAKPPAAATPPTAPTIPFD